MAHRSVGLSLYGDEVGWGLYNAKSAHTVTAQRLNQRGAKTIEPIEPLSHKDFVRTYSPEFVFDTLYTTDWSDNYA